MNAKKIAIVAVALAGVLGAGFAEARDRSDVQLSVTIGAPGYLPAYGPAVEVYRPAVRPHVVPQRPTRWDRDGDGIPNRYDRHPNRPDNGWQNGGYGRDGRGYGR